MGLTATAVGITTAPRRFPGCWRPGSPPPLRASTVDHHGPPDAFRPTPPGLLMPSETDRRWLGKAGTILVALVVALLPVFALTRFFPLVPVTRGFEFDDGVAVQLLSIRTEDVGGDDHVTWTVNVRNPTDTALALAPSTTCRHVFPPRDVGVPGAPVDHAEDFEVPAHQTSTWSDSCPAPDSGEWWLYTLSFEDRTGELRYPTVTFAGKAH
jgi:hypothetical protein